jgi:diacylglycerol kinase family enzyme
MAELRSLSTRATRVAVLLNANAKAVTPRVRDEISQFIPREDVYWSRSIDDAKSIAADVLAKSYEVALVGGGDGSFCGWVNALDAAAEKNGAAVRSRSGGPALQLAPEPAPLPRLGALKLGTGNALANVTGASGSRTGPVEDVLRARSGELQRTRKLWMVEHDGYKSVFAGFGMDASILNDYGWVKKTLGPVVGRTLSTGGFGYFFAIAGRSIPRYMVSRRQEVEVVNEGDIAWQLGPDGRKVGAPFEPGEVMFRGPCHLVAIGTCPEYGFGFKALPFCGRMPGTMQLRLSALSVPSILRNLPDLWRGRVPSTGILDFQVKKVSVRWSEQMPFQSGGDGLGWRQEATFSVSQRPIELVEFKS